MKKWRLDLSPWIWTYGRGSRGSISYCSFLSSCIIEVLLHSFLSRTPECFDFFLCQWRLTPIHHYHNTSTHHQQNQTQRKTKSITRFQSSRSYYYPSSLHAAKGSYNIDRPWTSLPCISFFYKFEYKPDWASSGFVDHPAIKEPMMGFVRGNPKPKSTKLLPKIMAKCAPIDLSDSTKPKPATLACSSNRLLATIIAACNCW